MPCARKLSAETAAAVQVLPLAFVAQSDGEKDVAELWHDVWDEATSGTPAALRLYIADIVPIVTAGLSPFHDPHVSRCRPPESAKLRHSSVSCWRSQSVCGSTNAAGTGCCDVS